MTQQIFRTAALIAALPFATAPAQQTRVFTFEPGRGIEVLRAATSTNRAMLGVTLHETSERADTLGLRVQSVTDNSPASKAGIKEGDRLQSINGVSLRADRADAGESDYEGVLMRRLQREMAKVQEEDTVTLRVLSDGRSREVRVVAVSPEQVFGSTSLSALRRVNNDRAVIGVTTSPVGNARDTLGVFVGAVNDSGPAAKAGIVEGDRIASINGVSLRVAREDAGDMQVSQARAERLRAELAKVPAGAAVELTVISAGRSRNVRVTTIKADELSTGAPSAWGFVSPPTAPAAPVAPAAPRVRTVLRDVRVL
jgi:C-terminal processing protease CtpA/Prc